MVSDLGLNSVVNGLTTALDQQADMLETRLSQLVVLREAIVSYDNDALEAVLELMERTVLDQAQCDANLRQASRHAATTVGLCASKTGLSLLINRLPQPHRDKLERRRVKLINQADSLRKKHMEISLLLREYARVNRELLERLLPGGNTVTVYGNAGRENWRGSSGIVNLEF